MRARWTTLLCLIAAIAIASVDGVVRALQGNRLVASGHGHTCGRSAVLPIVTTNTR